MAHDSSQFDRIVQEFEQAWRQGLNGEFGAWLQRVKPELKSKLAERLVPVEIQFRLQRGDQISPASDYHALEPSVVELIHKFLANNDPKALFVEQIEHFLAAHDQNALGADNSNPESDPEPNSDFDSPPPRDDLKTLDPKPADLDHSQRFPMIGNYKLLQKLGEGGMGTVWMAEQDRPVRRRVALKLIKGGLANKQVIARFEAERQVLAMMEHENIAKILDANTTSDGLPYFVMELVQGIPFNKYCDQNKLSIDERLRLFIPVCIAVQHAHQKGIIHRDLKPSNVLVCLHDGKPVPKVIDFGLAKALQHQMKLTDKTLFTEIGQVVGTLQYMSPEQAELNQLDIDTRTDIYSLGIMLYELLTGSTPIEADTLRNNAILQVLATIREKDPVRPSVRLSSITNEAVSGISSERNIESAKLKNILRGDLDWIVMHALEKDRTRRYATANGFAEDISRYLAGDVVTARPPSAGYRARKFVRKNRGLVASAATIATLLIAGIVGTTWFALGEQTQRIIADIKTDEATKSAKRSKDALQIFTDSFLSVDPLQGANAGMLARDVLSRAKDSLAHSELDDVGKAELLSALTTSFIGVGDYASAISTAEGEFEIRRVNQGIDHPDTLVAMTKLAVGYDRAGRTDKSIELKENVLKLRKTTLGPNHLQTLATMSVLASSYAQADRIAEAIELNENVLERFKSEFGEDDIQTLTVMSNLANNYSSAGRAEDAIPLNKNVLVHFKSIFGDQHPYSLTSMNNLANNYRQAGRTSEAIDLHIQVVALNKATVGDDHPDTLISMTNLAQSYSLAGQTNQAIELNEKVLELRKKVLGEDHPHTFLTMLDLGKLFIKKDSDRAIGLIEQVYEHRKSLNPDRWTTFSAQSFLGEAFLNQKNFDRAATHLIDSYRGLKLTANDIPGSVRSELLNNTINRLVELAKKTEDKEALIEWKLQKEWVEKEYPEKKAIQVSSQEAKPDMNALDSD